MPLTYCHLPLPTWKSLMVLLLASSFAALGASTSLVYFIAEDRTSMIA